MKKDKKQAPIKGQREQQNLNTNNTLKFKQGMNNTIYYLPAYARLIVKSISKLSYVEMSANLNVQLLISIRYEGIDEQIKRQLLRKGIRLSFDKDQNLLLKSQNKNVNLEDDSQNRLLNFIVTKFTGTILECDIRLSPFQKITSIMSITFNKVRLQPSEFHKDNIEIHFNLMDYEHQKLKIASSSDSNFGLFQVVKSQLSASYFETHLHQNVIKKSQNNPKPKNQERQRLKKTKQKAHRSKASGKQRPQAFNAAHFRVPLFKMPVVGILTIFLPLLLLSIINLGIFFEEKDLHQRIVSIAAIMVSIVALIPVIRQQIPPTPTITVVQILVFVQALTTILVLLQSLVIQSIPVQQFNFIWYENTFFMLALILTIIVNVIVGVLTFLHYMRWVPYYRKDGVVEMQTADIDDPIETIKWKNTECNKKFLKYFKMKIIEVVTDQHYRQTVLFKSMLKNVHELKEQKDIKLFVKKSMSVAIEEQDEINEMEMDSNQNINVRNVFNFDLDKP